MVLSKTSRQALCSTVQEPVVAAVMPGQQRMELAKAEDIASQRRLPRLGTSGVRCLFRRKTGILFYDGLDFLCDSFFQIHQGNSSCKGQGAS